MDHQVIRKDQTCMHGHDNKRDKVSGIHAGKQGGATQLRASGREVPWAGDAHVLTDPTNVAVATCLLNVITFHRSPCLRTDLVPCLIILTAAQTCPAEVRARTLSGLALPIMLPAVFARVQDTWLGSLSRYLGQDLCPTAGGAGCMHCSPGCAVHLVTPESSNGMATWRILLTQCWAFLVQPACLVTEAGIIDSLAICIVSACLLASFKICGPACEGKHFCTHCISARNT